MNPSTDHRLPVGTAARAVPTLAFALALLVAGCGPMSRLPIPPAGALSKLSNCDVDYPDWQTSPYILPYPVGESYELLQANCSQPTHNGDIAFGYDFLMPIGSTVIAARSGKVIEAVDRHPNWGAGAGVNIVVLRHRDGTLARYGHLSPGSVQVKVGQLVRQGTPIARSGASNLARDNTAHLHFHVQREKGRQTLAVTFRNTRPHPDGLKWRESYRAEPFEVQHR